MFLRSAQHSLTSVRVSIQPSVLALALLMQGIEAVHSEDMLEIAYHIQKHLKVTFPLFIQQLIEGRGTRTALGSLREYFPALVIIPTIKQGQEPQRGSQQFLAGVHTPHNYVNEYPNTSRGRRAGCLFLDRLGSKAFSHRLCLCKLVFCAASAAFLTFKGSTYSSGYKHAGILFAPFLFGLTHVLSDKYTGFWFKLFFVDPRTASFIPVRLHLCAVLLTHFVVLCDQLIRFQAEQTGRGLPFFNPLTL